MTENERLTIDEIIQHCNRTCENTEIMAISKGQTQEDITAKSYWEHYQVSNYLEELKQYRAIGTVEEFKALKGKNTSKKVVAISLTHEGRVGNCPNCNNFVLERKDKNCPKCRRELDWHCKLPSN